MSTTLIIPDRVARDGVKQGHLTEAEYEAARKSPQPVPERWKPFTPADKFLIRPPLPLI